MKRIIIAFALALVCLGASAQKVATNPRKPRTAKIAKKKPVKLSKVKRKGLKVESKVQLDPNAGVNRRETATFGDTQKIKKRRVTPKKPFKPTKKT